MKPYSQSDLIALLTRGELVDIFPLLEEIVEQKNEPVLSVKVGNLGKEFETLRKHQRLGILGFSEMTETKNRITYDLLSIIQELS